MNNHLYTATTIFCIMSLWQDFLGKEKYLEYVNNNWVDYRISVPITLCILILSVLYQLKENEKGRISRD